MTLPDPTALTSAAARALSGAYLVTSMLSMGLELGRAPAEDKAHKRARRWLLARGLAVNLLLPPIVALAIIRALHVTGDVRLALVVLAAAPGGRFAPQLTRIAGGDLGLSVEIMLFLAKVTMLTGPFLVHQLLEVEHFRVHDLQLVAQLTLLQVVPYVLGRQLQRRRSAWARRLAWPLDVLRLAIVAAIFLFLVANQQVRSVLLLGGRGWLALLLMAPISLALGTLLAGSSPAMRRAIALGVNARNLGLALLMAELALPEPGVASLIFAGWLVLSLFGLAVALLARQPPLAHPLAHRVH